MENAIGGEKMKEEWIIKEAEILIMNSWEVCQARRTGKRGTLLSGVTVTEAEIWVMITTLDGHWYGIIDLWDQDIEPLI